MTGKIFGGLLWGMIADKWKCHRLLSVLTCILSILCLIVGQLGASIAFASDQEANRCQIDYMPTNRNLSSSSSSSPSSMNRTLPNTPASRKPGNNTISMAFSTYDANAENDHEGVRFGSLFFALLILSMLNMFCDSGLEFLDTATVRRIQTSAGERKVNYGQQRVVAPLGGTIGNILTNISIQYFPRSNISCFAGMFVCYTVFSLLSLFSTLLVYRGLSFRNDNHELAGEAEDVKVDKYQVTENNLVTKPKVTPEYSNDDEDDDKTSENVSINFSILNIQDNKNYYKKLFFNTMIRNDILFLLISTTIAGIFFSPLHGFHYLLLKDLNAPAFTFSLITVAGGMGAIVGFKFSDKLLKIMTLFKALSVCYVSCALVHLCYNVADTPWLLVIPRPLFGVAFCVSVSSGMAYLKDNCPVDVLTSVISIYVALFYGVGSGIGLAVSGEIYDVYGGKTMFGIMACVSFAWSLVVGFYYYFSYLKNRKI